jgi:predicted secreted protein
MARERTDDAEVVCCDLLDVLEDVFDDVLDDCFDLVVLGIQSSPPVS